MQVWDLATDAAITRIEGHPDKHPLRRIEFTEDSLQIIACWADGAFHLFDAATGDMVRTFRGHTETVNTARQVPGRRRIVSASRDVSLRLWDMDTGESLVTFGKAKNEARLPQVPTQEDLMKLDGHIAWIRDVAPLRDGRLAISAGNDAMLFVWDVDSGILVDKIAAHSGNVFHLVLSPDGELLLSNADDQRIRLTPTAPPRKPLFGLRFADSVRPAMAIAHGRHVGAIGSEERMIHLRDLDHPETILETLPLGPALVTSLAFTTDDEWLLAGYLDGSVVAWPVGAILLK